MSLPWQDPISSIKITRMCMVRGDTKVAGTVLSVGRNGDVDEKEAKDIIAANRAVQVSGKGK